MKVSLLALGLLPLSPAFADSLCVSLQGASLKNVCAECMEVTLYELRPPGEQHLGVYSGVTRKVRLDSGEVRRVAERRELAERRDRQVPLKL